MDTNKLMSETVSLDGQPTKYRVIIGSGIIPEEGSQIDELLQRPEKTVLITNPVVAGFYLESVKGMLDRLEHSVQEIIIPDGEEYKSLETASQIFDRLAALNISRSDLIVGLGGGVIGDLAGFAASTFKRGVRLIQFPTTVLSQVDSSVGGKTAVNHESGKNMIGTFYQPELVIADISTLNTLKDREFLNGLAEVIKYAVIGDADLFEFLQKERDAVLARNPVVMKDIVRRCVAQKRDIVEADEKETCGIREVLNFGHTYGHAAEIITGFSLKHGEAVAIGMVEEARRACEENVLPRDEYQRIIDLIASYGLPVELKGGFETSVVADLLSRDKKVRYGKLRIPVPQKIGKTVIKEIKCSKLL